MMRCGIILRTLKRAKQQNVYGTTYLAPYRTNKFSASSDLEMQPTEDSSNECRNTLHPLPNLQSRGGSDLHSQISNNESELLELLKSQYSYTHELIPIDEDDGDERVEHDIGEVVYDTVYPIT
ncbi:uncharacterized protein OCT59_018023 [Rhizophagus irregularis]|uniref:Uncharacterized protein n=1 Tax=Rhizophagus irregularis TaxID=588596 RepID=A0A916DWV5_9GLOM|nr:hypothetical protein OCT59_018023 [Rhizophagus irregularis]CAB5291435.1 unnamed protein product [Rhizophagus irregularis]